MGEEWDDGGRDASGFGGQVWFGGLLLGGRRGNLSAHTPFLLNPLFGSGPSRDRHLRRPAASLARAQCVSRKSAAHPPDAPPCHAGARPLPTSTPPITVKSDVSPPAVPLCLQAPSTTCTRSTPPP